MATIGRGVITAQRPRCFPIDINPAVAYRINKHFSVGAGISAQYIDAELKNKVDYGTIDAALAVELLD